MADASVWGDARAVKARLINGYRDLPRDLRKVQDAHPVKLVKVAAIVGDLAMDIWMAMLGLRYQHAIAHPSIAGLCRMVGAPRRSVQRALARLREAGLVVGRGWEWINQKVGRNVHCWDVWGALRRSRSGPIVWVPRATLAWLAKAEPPATHGGKRAGSGRPKKEKAPMTKPFVPRAKPETKSSGAPIRGVSKRPPRNPSGVTQGSTRADAREANSEFRIRGGSTVDAGGWWPWLVREGHVPRPPTAQRLPLVTIRVPDKLNPSDEPLAMAEECARAFRAVIAAVTGKPCYVFARGALENSKHYDVLVDWCRFMTTQVEPESQIAPVFWLRWMQTRWEFTKLGKSGAPMPVPFAFKLDTLAKPSNRGWCRSELGAERIQPGKVVTSKPLKELRRRYSAMRVAIYRLGPWSPADQVGAIVEKFFPDGLFEVLEQEAKVAQKRLQQRLDERSSAGDLSLWNNPKKGAR
jgi:DNA-binding transcriptional ArsR family regulator